MGALAPPPPQAALTTCLAPIALPRSAPCRSVRGARTPLLARRTGASGTARGADPCGAAPSLARLSSEQQLVGKVDEITRRVAVGARSAQHEVVGLVERIEIKVGTRLRAAHAHARRRERADRCGRLHAVSACKGAVHDRYDGRRTRDATHPGSGRRALRAAADASCEGGKHHRQFFTPLPYSHRPKIHPHKKKNPHRRPWCPDRSFSQHVPCARASRRSAHVHTTRTTT
eukprot:731235-Prymnesium_polylepis.2